MPQMGMMGFPSAGAAPWMDPSLLSSTHGMEGWELLQKTLICLRIPAGRTSRPPANPAVLCEKSPECWVASYFCSLVMSFRRLSLFRLLRFASMMYITVSTGSPSQRVCSVLIDLRKSIFQSTSVLSTTSCSWHLLVSHVYVYDWSSCSSLFVALPWHTFPYRVYCLLRFLDCVCSSRFRSFIGFGPWRSGGAAPRATALLWWDWC